MKNNILLLMIAFFTLTCNGARAQQAIPAAGGMASGSEGSVSYSVGQVLYSLNAGTTGTVSEGVEQPYEILIPTGIEKREKENEYTIYPNPSAGNVTLKIDKADLSGFSYVVYSMTGKRMLESEITDKETIIPMEDLEKGVYLLRITCNDYSAGTFYIIKK